MGNRPQRRHLEVITPPVLDRPAPTTRCRIEASRWDWFLVNVLRPVWGYRVELAVLVVALVAGRWLMGRFGDLGGGVIFLGLVVGLLVWQPSRSFTYRLFHGSRLHRRWSLALRHAGLATYNDRIPRPVDVRLIPPGDQVRVKIPPGSSASELADKAQVIAACLGVRELKVKQEEANAKFAEVIVVRRDPLSGGEALPWPNVAVPSVSMWEPIPVGIDEMGGVVWMCLVESNLLAGGLPGAGKSVVLQMVVATAALDPSVELTLFDGKLVEFAFWRSCASRFVGPSLEEAIDVLRQLQAEMEERYRFLLEKGRRKVERGDGFALHVIVIDELAFYVDVERRLSKLSDEFEALLTDLVRRGRAAGIIVVAATQKPSGDVVDTSLRDLFGFRWALRCSTWQASDTILGSGWASDGWSASSIAPADKGVGFLLHEEGEPTRLKAFYLSDDDLRALAARAEELRHPAVEPTPLHPIEEEDSEEGEVAEGGQG